MFRNKVILQGKKKNKRRTERILSWPSQKIGKQKYFQGFNGWTVIRNSLSHNTLARVSPLALTAASRMWRKEYRDERPHNSGRCWWMFKQAQADCGSAPAGCAEEFRLTYIYIIVKNLLYAYCVPRGRGRRNVWKPCNQPWDPIRKCLADGKHRWSCCVYIFGNKG